MADAIVDPLLSERVKLGVRKRLFGDRGERLEVGRFEVLDRIGAGGMSVVYAARDHELGRTVALKLLQDARSAERLLREARALARLRHPNVVAVFDVGTWRGHLFIAMEHVEGKTLGAWRAGGSRSWRDVVRVMLGAGEGLAAAHAVGLVHRDVKPDNIVVDEAGQARVVDFGLVRGAEPEPVERSEEASKQGDHTTANAGTPLYMAPERARGEPATPASDQYSFALTMCEALEGAGAPAWIDRIVRRGLEREPADRFPSMRAMLDALAREPAQASRRLAPLLALVGIVAIAAYVWARPKAAVTAAPADGDTSDDPPIFRDFLIGTSNDAARAALRTALRAMRNADDDRAVPALKEAMRLDPDYAAPHLWLAVLHGHGTILEARPELAKALGRRAELGPVNAAFALALAPCLLTDPIDNAGCADRLAELGPKNPKNAFVWYQLAGLRWAMAGPSEAALADFDRAIEADPGYALPRFGKGQVLAYLGRFDDALASEDECVRAVPSATLCLRDRIWIDAERGDCAAVEADARRWQAATPTATLALAYRASVSRARAEPPEVATELLRQAADRALETQRPFFSARDRVLLDIDAGDFAGARRDLGALEASVAHEQNRAARLLGPRLAIMIALETGDTAEAKEVATRALRSIESWLPDPRVEDFSIAADFAPVLLDVLRETGALTDSERAARRKAWLDAWRARTTKTYFPYLWLSAYARNVDDEAEAREAEAAMAELGRPAFHPLSYPDGGIGRMFLLIGKAREAQPFLRRAAHSCAAAEFYSGAEIGWNAVRAELDLGRAHEALGETSDACAAYDRVIARWGRASPPSVTAGAARARRKALRCSGDGG